MFAKKRSKKTKRLAGQNVRYSRGRYRTSAKKGKATHRKKRK